MRRGTLLSKTSWFWPVALFPYYERSHTAAYTGTEWVKDVKMSIGFARLCLTEESLSCTLLFPRFRLFEIALSDISAFSMVEGKKGLLEVRYQRAHLSWWTRFCLSGDPAVPRDRVVLNLGDELDRWLGELSRLTGLVPQGPASGE